MNEENSYADQEYRPAPDEFLKPELEESKSKLNIWVKSIASLLLFLFLGYLFFNKNWTLVLILTAVIIIHELGHFLAMKFFNYQELGIFFIPLLGAYVSGKKQEISQKQSAIILMAGPVPGILIGILLYYLAFQTDQYLLERVAWIFIFLNLLNLLPVYPLDGGQLLHRLFLDDHRIIGYLFVTGSIILLTWIAISSGFYILLFFPFMLATRMFQEYKLENMTQKLEAEGINLTRTYEDISAEEYWEIRNAIIRHHPLMKDIPPSPPYEISQREDQVIMIIQSLLQREIIQDLSLSGKFLILLIWVGCFTVPFLLGLSLRLF